MTSISTARRLNSPALPARPQDTRSLSSPQAPSQSLAQAAPSTVDSFTDSSTSASGGVNLSGSLLNPALSGAGSLQHTRQGATGVTSVQASGAGQLSLDGFEGGGRVDAHTRQQLGNTRVEASGTLQGSTEAGLSGSGQVDVHTSVQRPDGFTTVDVNAQGATGSGVGIDGSLRHRSTVQNDATTTRLEVDADVHASRQTGGASALGGSFSVGLERTGPNSELLARLNGRAGTGSGASLDGSLDWGRVDLQTRPDGSSVASGANVSARGQLAEGVGQLEVDGTWKRVAVDANGQPTSRTELRGGLRAHTEEGLSGQLTGSHTSGSTQASGQVVRSADGRVDLNASLAQQLDGNTRLQVGIDSNRLDAVSVGLNRELGRNGNAQLQVDSQGKVSGQVQYRRTW